VPLPEPRSLAERTADAVALLQTRHADLWLASASATVAHLVPVSFCWTGEHVIVATEPGAVTTRNVLGSGRARLALGKTRDVVMIDASLAGTVDVRSADVEVADTYAEQADWDPRQAGDDFVYLLLRPERIQVWREANEIKGRTVMRHGRWLAPVT
jgi:hypothetical protein